MDIRTFASLVGVSTATVSRAFSGRGVVGAKTREHVLGEARRLNFSPNILARRLSMRSSGMLGLYYSFGDEPVFDYYNMELAQEVTKAAADAGYGLHLELAPRRTPVQDDPATRLATLAAGKSLDGIVLVSDGRESARALFAQTGGTPAVVITGEPLDGLPFLAQIVIDFVPGIRAAVDHLVADGHRRIGCIRGLGDGARSMVRNAKRSCRRIRTFAQSAGQGARCSRARDFRNRRLGERSMTKRHGSAQPFAGQAAVTSNASQSWFAVCAAIASLRARLA